jgi:tetratricopeptide (TPR) repeat protein
MDDRYGLPMTTSSLQAADQYQEGLDLTLSQQYGAEEQFTQAIEADEGFALAHAALAFTLMIRVAVPEARASAERAKALTSGVTRREKQHIEAISLFVHGQNDESYALLRQQISEFPRDVLILRLAQRLFVLGCAGAGEPNYPPMFFDLMKGVEHHYGEDWAFMGQHAWAHHEVGLMDEGMRLAQRSLDLRPDNAVAVHSVAHVQFETGDSSQGSDFLGGWLQSFDRRASYRVHLSWHQALFQLALGHYTNAMALYENDIRPAVAAKSYQALADSASLVWRMNIYGDTVPQAPWDELLALAAPAAERPGPAFRDTHAALAFTAANDETSLGRLIDGLKDAAAKGSAVAAECTLPLVQGIVAFGQGEYSDAVRLIAPVVPQLTRVGGSHAQREVFEDTLLEAYLRAEDFDKAETMLRERLGRRESPRDNFWLARVQANTGQPEVARTSLSTVTQGWESADVDSLEFGALNRLADRLG